MATMTEDNENIQISGLDSKFMKVAMTVVAVFLMFIGPTYIPFLLSDVLKADYIASIGIGAVLFVLGFVVLIYLIRKKVIQ
jgi:membrane protein YdbS with pleckstrin-like domain